MSTEIDTCNYMAVSRTSFDVVVIAKKQRFTKPEAFAFAAWLVVMAGTLADAPGHDETPSFDEYLKAIRET